MPNSSPLYDRRDVLMMLGAGTLFARAGFAAADQPFHFTGIDHVTLTVSDVDKSVAFYTRLFGDTVMKDKHGPQHYVKAGSNYVAMAPKENDREGLGGNLIGLGIQSFRLSEAKSSLDQFGIPRRHVNGQGVVVVDPDGILTQIWVEDSWSELGKTAQPVSALAAGEPLLRPTAMNHLLLAVSDPEKSAKFYAKILGPIAQRTAARPPLSGRIWFLAGKHRIGLAPLNQGINTGGQRPGIDHFGLIAEFDRATLTKGLTEAGAKVLPQGEGPEAAGVDFLDVNGVRLQVMPPPKPRA